MKYLSLIAFVFITSACLAQERVNYITANDKLTLVKDIAYIISTIKAQVPGTNLYAFTEEYATGEPYRTGQTSNKDRVITKGDVTYFYPSGKKLCEVEYNGDKLSKQTAYFANGSIYLIKEFSYIIPDITKPKEVKTVTRIITCNSSNGKPLVTNGNGHFISSSVDIDPKFMKYNAGNFIYNSLFDEITVQGDVKNGLPDGEWLGKSPSTSFAYTEVFDNGKFISGKSTDKDGKKYDYKVQEAAAEFPAGINGFYVFLGSTIRYPLKDRVNKVEGKVFATFVINRDGSLGEIEILRSPSQDMSDETIRVLNLSPQWQPSRQHGIPVRQQYTIPVSYALQY